ncbi:MAG TPA: DUF5060 domain-containing protein, partial [Ohtaekwangia sp.]|nr:DUF5060 domain-containing protein [Ohtaekwangia sp.]
MEPLRAQQIQSVKLLSMVVTQFEKAEFDVVVSAPFDNPFDLREIVVDLLLRAPSGKPVLLPVYFVSGTPEKSLWKARFTPQEAGAYRYHFQLVLRGKSASMSPEGIFVAGSSQANGFLHVS